MGDILSVGQNQNCLKKQEQWIDTSDFLRKSNHFGEFSEQFPGPNGETIDEIAMARANLDVYNKYEVEDLVDRRIDEELERLVTHSDGEQQVIYTKKILINGKVPTQFGELETILLYFIAENIKLYNLLQFFSAYSQINICPDTSKTNSFSLKFVLGNKEEITYTATYQGDDITVTRNYGVSNLAQKFISIIGTAITEFLETITKTIYTENFYNK